MNIVFRQCHSSNFKAGRTQGVKYITIHYTANNGDTAKNNADYYANNKNLSASAHYFVDENEIYQSVGDNDTAWAVGATSYKHPYCRNANSISIELCSRNPKGKVAASDKGWYFKPETVANAVALTKVLMARYGVPVQNVLRHYDVTSKNCPAPFVNDESKWKAFKEALEVNKYSYDKTVDNMIKDGITTPDNMAYWEKVLDGREPLNKDYVRAVLDRYSGKVRGA